jgi:hypothetical protein
MEAFENLKRQIDKQAGKLDELRSRKQELEAEINSLVDEQVLLQETHEVLKLLLDKMSHENVGQIEGLVTFGLKSIFGHVYEDIRFFFKKSVKRDLLHYEPMLSVDGVEASLDDSFGGGMLCVISFILRLIVVTNLGLYPLIVGDEIFAGVSEEFQKPCSEFLRTMAERMGCDFLLVTHQEQFAENAHVRYKCHKVHNQLVMKSF